MKFLLTLFLSFFLALSAQADIASTPKTPEVFTAQRGTSNVATQIPTIEQCWAKNEADAKVRLSPTNKTLNYACVGTSKSTYTYVAPPAMNNMVVIDTSKIPVAVPGFTTARIEPAPGPFGQDDSQGPEVSDVGAFRLVCNFAKMSFDDPLVFPGQPGASHLHTFMGNDGTNASSTTTSITNSGGSTCAGGILNRSSYWVPAMVDTTTGTPMAPLSMLVYYKTGYGGVLPPQVKAVPTGLRMISGSASGTPTSGTSASRYACLGGSDQDWHDYIPVCTAGATEMLMEVSFPQCWDGINLSSPNNKDHMAETTGSGCPATHPIPLPKIDYEVHYKVTPTMAKWRLSSDNYSFTSPGGYSGHGDYWMGWDVPTMKKIIDNCDNPSIDCHTNLLGDGTWLY